ncbi:hypothetical protein [Methanimicrococcus hongohii]|uniref:hypothetical protein n=1 Tax=Methanimicrococcus hongohii TaxID=3028295 RepID=UPI00292DC415|nr:hypothetical protein [Methanimicrococcus sp. Hf6]
MVCVKILFATDLRSFSHKISGCSGSVVSVCSWVVFVCSRSVVSVCSRSVVSVCSWRAVFVCAWSEVFIENRFAIFAATAAREPLRF